VLVLQLLNRYFHHTGVAWVTTVDSAVNFYLPHNLVMPLRPGHLVDLEDGVRLVQIIKTLADLIGDGSFRIHSMSSIDF